jgi:hypothetical protein
MMATDPLTELSDLRLFLQERVQTFDNSINTDIGSLFDSTVISPLIDRLSPDPYNVPIRDFILGRLSREFPNLVLQDGEPIDDYAVKIMQILLEAYRRQIKQVSVNQSLANPSQLNEREADNLAANFFVRRRLGGYSVGIARLYYSNPQYALVTPSNAVYDASGHRFFPVENQAITADRMLFNEENGLYYFDIVTRAESQGKDYDIPLNTLTGIEGASAVVKVANKTSFSEGADKENTETFLARVENSLTEKSLVTLRGIRSRLFDTFENIRLIQVIGFGDPEMKRDIVKGSSQSSPYAFFMGEVVTGQPYIDLDLGYTHPFVTSAGVTYTDFINGGVLVGDIVEVLNEVTGDIGVFKVLERQAVGSVYTRLLMDGNQQVSSGTLKLSIRRASGVITISDIPGGILIPTTQAGNIEIQDGEVHIGGVLDVFVRAGTPQQKSTTLTGVLDGSPLHFGLDLESFGDAEKQRVHITERMINKAAIPAEDRFGDALSTLNQIVVEAVDGTHRSSNETNPWVPAEGDIGRFIQLLGGNALSDGGPDFGTFKITDVLDKEYFKDDAGNWHTVVRIQIDTANYETGTSSTLHHTVSGVGQGVFDLSVRLLEEVSIKDRVRDRDSSTIAIPADTPNPGDLAIPGGVDFLDLGAKIGDSTVIETGDDAGIYSIRRVLSWLSDNDTLILDRELTRSLTPSGSGSGLRYRIADELNVDLISPKVTKIPLGEIFLGDDLSTVAGSTVVNVSSSTNFLLAGVEAGDTLEIRSGDNAGKYGVKSVTGTTATLDGAVLTTTFSQEFAVYREFTGVTRPMVRVKSVELLDSNSQPTGIKIPYGDLIDARILGTLSNRAEGNIVESYLGELEDNGAGLYDLHDPMVNFPVEGVTIEHRLNILSGNSAEAYSIIAVGTGDGLPSDNHIRVAPVSSGGVQFRTTDTNIHYSVGLPSAGIIRLYFSEPTSVEVKTGLSGGRVYNEETGVPKVFQFSPVSGYSILPAGGSGEDTPRDIRLVRNYEASPYESIVELTDFSRPNVFQLELQEGDVLEVNEKIQFSYRADLPGIHSWGGTTTVSCNNVAGLRVGMHIALKSDGQLFEITDIAGYGPYTVTISNPNGWAIPTGSTGSERVATFEQLGVFGKSAGLRTVAGSNLVDVPTNSLIDFTAMNRLYPLAGQVLIIDSGPDSGRYVIEEVVSSKRLRLNMVMTSTTDSILGGDMAAPIRNATLADSGSNTRITDTVDGSQLKSALPGYFITIFESNRGDLDGSWEVSDLLTSPSVPNTIEINTNGQFVNEASSFSALDPFAVGSFSWVKTSSDTNVEQPFGIYQEVPTELAVTQVATKREDWPYGIRRGTITSDGGVKNTLTDAESGFTMGALQGDMVEILAGPNAGVYTLKLPSTGNVAKIQAYPEFPVTMSDVPYRIWGGLHGSTRMVTVGPKDSFTGKLDSGASMPYRIRRAGVERVGSTVMETQFDGLLYYVDIQIESQGAGDDLNLLVGSRMSVKSGMTVDGYTYSVQNTNLTFSMFEEVSLIFDRRFLPVGNSDSPENLTEVSGRNIQITYEVSTPVQLVDDLMRSETDRPINANPMARHFLPSYVFTNFTYSGGVSEIEVGKDLEDYINQMGAQAELEISDLEALIVKRGANYVKHPILLATVTHDLDRKLIVNRSDNKLGGMAAVPFNGTGRISCFFATLGEGLTLVRES